MTPAVLPSFRPPQVPVRRAVQSRRGGEWIVPRRALKTLFFALAIVLGAEPAAGQTNSRAEIGMNLWFHVDYNNSFAFTDLVRRARNWGSVDSPSDSSQVRVDELGWPEQDAAVFLHVSIDAAGLEPLRLVNGPAPLPAGTYRIVFNGQANLIDPSTGAVVNQRYDTASNTTRADWVLEAQDERNSASISFVGTRRTGSSAEGTGLTNLRIFLPGFPDDGSVTFTPAFRDAIARFGIVRFMDWIDANRNAMREFSERITPAHASYSLITGSDDLPEFDFTNPLRGVAIEHMVQLCNETDTDMWINIPVRATDECVRQMLELIRDGSSGFAGLEPERRLYLEYGNEIWNGFGPGFQCFPRVSALAQQVLQNERTSGVPHPINFDRLFPAAVDPGILTAANETLTGDEPFLAAQMRWRFIAFRIKTISDMARQVFGDAQMMSRVRPILAWQFGDGQVTASTGLRFLDEFAGTARDDTEPRNPVARRVNEIVFGGGGAPYALTGGNTSSARNYFRRFPHADFAPSSRVDATLARAYGIRYVAYEGGPSLGDPVTGAGTLPEVTERRLNADPRMGTAFRTAHNIWKRAGGDIIVYYVLTGDPTFEFAGTDTDSNSPKLRALARLLGQRLPDVSTGKLVPATFRAGTAPHLYNEGCSILDRGRRVLLNDNEFVGRSQLLVPLRTARRAPRNVTVRIETNGLGRGSSSFDVFLNGRLLGRINVTGDSAPAFQVPGPRQALGLEGGLNVLMLRAAEGQTEIRRIEVAAAN